MAILSFHLDQFFILMMPFLVFAGNAGGNAIDFPSEPDFVQKVLSILWHYVLGMRFPLRFDPPP
jgi:hypothetical protein